MPNNKFSQISLFDIYEDVNTSFTEKKSELVSLLEKHIDFSSLISYDFNRAFYSTFGRKHKYHLVSFIKALIIHLQLLHKIVRDAHPQFEMFF